MAPRGEEQPISKPRVAVEPESRARRGRKRKGPSNELDLMGRIPIVVVVTDSQGVKWRCFCPRLRFQRTDMVTWVSFTYGYVQMTFKICFNHFLQVFRESLQMLSRG